MNIVRLPMVALACAAFALAGCGKTEKAATNEAPAKSEAKPAAKASGEAKAAAHGKEAGGHAEESVIKLSDAEVKQGGIKTAKVAEDLVRAGINVSATIQPNRDRYAKVAPRVPGRIVEVPAKAGEAVRAGQVLARLDSVELGESTSAQQQAQSQYNVAKADFDRAQGLYDEKVIPQKDYLRARAELEKSRAALTAANEKLRMMGLSSGGAMGSILPVTAPFAGTVIEKAAVIGELAQPDKPLFIVADLSTVWIEANLYEKDLARIRTGAMAEVTVSAYPDARFSGRLAYVSATVDRESRTVKGRIEVPNKDGRLKPEMFASAVIESEEGTRAIAVPADAVVLLENKTAVFVKEVDGFEKRAVELGERVGNRQIVKAGLTPGDEVVVAGTYALKSRVLKSKLGEGHAH